MSAESDIRTIVDASEFPDDLGSELTLRPHSLQEFIGQTTIKNNLQIFIAGAKTRNESLDHVLLYGPPGLGKTTLSQIVAHEMQVGFKTTSGPVLSKTGELAAILTNLQKHDVLFIDEIHRLNTAVEELLYSAMEDYAIDIIIGDGPAARTVKINLPPFTLIGATTRMGLLTNPLRDRFGIHIKLDFYSISELEQVIHRGASIMKIKLQQDAAKELAQCSRGTPRIALRLLRRLRDFADHLKIAESDLKLVRHTLFHLGVDNLGLDILDYKYIKYIAQYYNGGPVGIETIAAGIAEDKDTIEDVIEPYLMQMGFLARTPRGRTLTPQCIKHLNDKAI